MTRLGRPRVVSLDYRLFLYRKRRTTHCIAPTLKINGGNPAFLLPKRTPDPRAALEEWSVSVR